MRQKAARQVAACHPSWWIEEKLKILIFEWGSFNANGHYTMIQAPRSDCSDHGDVNAERGNSKRRNHVEMMSITGDIQHLERQTLS